MYSRLGRGSDSAWLGWPDRQRSAAQGLPSAPPAVGSWLPHDQSTVAENGGREVEPMITAYLSGLELGEPQGVKNLVVIPLFSSLSEGPKYTTLSRALKKGILAVTEVHETASVPELKVTNRGDARVLLLDGEELAGAKQNRVLNATILLKKKSETVIPVSCTEQGRWSYVSDRFADSGVVMSPRMRGSKQRAVSASLEQRRSFVANQGLVWAEIEEMSATAQVSSSTQAMRDIFRARTADLEAYLSAFRCMPHQRGLLAIVNGKVAGFDFLSRESAYERAHPKLIRSYALDALLQSSDAGAEPPPGAAEAFLEAVSKCEGTKYKSVGHGWDHRFRQDELVGSALTFRNVVIHMAFFYSDARKREERIARYRQRRDLQESLVQRVVPAQETFLGPEEAVSPEQLEQELALEDMEDTQP